MLLDNRCYSERTTARNRVVQNSIHSGVSTWFFCGVCVTKSKRDAAVGVRSFIAQFETVSHGRAVLSHGVTHVAAIYRQAEYCWHHWDQ